jgi:glycosyltransferase involved in cell wall biosynthesis
MQPSPEPDKTAVRLVHLADYGGAYPGSFVPMVRSVLQRARKRGWHVQAVFSQVAGDRAWLSDLRAQGFTCTVAPDERAPQRELVEDLCSQAGGALILHSHFTSFDLAVAAAARRHERVIAYWHLHSALRPGAWWQTRNIAKLRLLSRGVEEILCVAPNILEQARRRGAPRDRLVLVPNAIDLDRFPFVTAERRHAARTALGLPPEAPAILHFGWDWQRKGGDLLLRSVASLLSMGRLPPESIVLSAGAPREASRLAESLGIAEHFRALPPSDDVADLYAAADLFAAPSRGEGHPFAVAEALASGLPVVASPIPGHRMIAEQIGNCQIAALNAAALADAIATVLSRAPREQKAAGQDTRELVAAELDIGAWSEHMLARYERALARR